MPRIFYLAAHRRPPGRVFFSRRELNQLLALYSRRVISGEWRDYAIDHSDGVAVFSIFRHSFDRPLYAIAKRPAGAGGRDQFLLLSGGRTLKRGDSIDDVLSTFEPMLRVVS
jgi:hypothetical protein